MFGIVKAYFHRNAEKINFALKSMDVNKYIFEFFNVFIIKERFCFFPRIFDTNFA